MTRFVMAIPLLLVIVLLAGAASAASAQSSGCDNGVAVANPSNNPGLVADCEALLSARDTLAGTGGTLDWSATTPIANWEGVTVSGTPRRVTELHLSHHTQLAGEIPPELGNLANLEQLWLYGGDQLTGAIPPELGNLANLEALSLHGTQLTGAIPPELGNLANLEYLSLWVNQLTGEIPSSLGNLTNLEELWLSSGDQLTGSIPPELGNLSDLKRLILNHNQFTGSIPPELGNLANLETLGLYDNQFTGSIPPELGNLADLRGLDLAYNQLTGEIPAELGNLSNLYTLSLDFNQLTGAIPSWLGNLTNLEELGLGNNQLTGSIPPELGNLANLEYLYLSYNQLTGCIPAGLRDVAYNDFTELGLDFCTGALPQNPSMSVSPNQGIPGDSINVQLHDFQTGDVVTRIEFARTVDICDDADSCFALGARGAVGDNGSLSFSFVIPNYVSPGAQDLRVHTTNGNANTTFIVGDGDPCLEVESLGALTAPVTKTGVWADDCDSEARPGSYARYYSFTLDQAGQVEMNLTSSVDAYLALRQGGGRNGTTKASNDNVGSRNFNSSINEMLVAGTYTIEATTYFAGQTGDFILSVRPLQETEDLGDLTRSVDRSNSAWSIDYLSTQQEGSYARSYTFTLDAATHVVINLTSPEDPYLYVLDSNGAVVHENDNVTTRNLNSRIDEVLQRGTYTIEATTYFPARMGTFHLSIGYFGSSE